MDEFNKEDAKYELKKNYKKAEKLLENNDKMEKFLQRLEKKLKLIPALGNTLSYIPTMISLVRSYIKKEYSNIPLGSIIAIVSCLIYFLTPIDVIPDAVAGVGYVDDGLVIAACIKLVGSDVKEYQSWREENNKNIEK